jgi:hypothetical protein
MSVLTTFGGPNDRRKEISRPFYVGAPLADHATHGAAVRRDPTDGFKFDPTGQCRLRDHHPAWAA